MDVATMILLTPQKNLHVASWMGGYCGLMPWIQIRLGIVACDSACVLAITDIWFSRFPGILPRLSRSISSILFVMACDSGWSMWPTPFYNKPRRVQPRSLRPLSTDVATTPPYSINKHTRVDEYLMERLTALDPIQFAAPLRQSKTRKNRDGVVVADFLN